MISDAAEGITNISWNVYGKIAEIQRNGTAQKPVTTIKYTYDAAGNRIGKAVWKLGDVLPTNTYYVRDASGNVMGIYESGQTTGYNLTQKEVHLYGSSRLGILNTDVNVQSGNLLVNNTGTVTFTRGNKFFELSNPDCRQAGIWAIACPARSVGCSPPSPIKRFRLAATAQRWIGM